MTLDSDIIEDNIKTLELETESIESQIYDITLNTEGGICLHEARSLSAKDRNVIMDKINKKIEARSGKEWL